MKLVIGAPSEASELIKRWNGGTVCSMLIHLSNDNKTVQNCSVLLIGELYPDRKVISLNGVYESCPALSISVGPIVGDTFDFIPGKTYSELKDSSRMDHHFLKDGYVLDAAGVVEAGLTGFTLRAYIVPSGAEWTKLVVLLYPVPTETLLNDHPACADPRFPGISLLSKDIQLEPTTLSTFAKIWGCSILPAIIPGEAFTTSFPSSADLRAAISATLRSAVKPEVKKGYATLLPRWEAIREHGASQLKDVTLDLIWPVSTPAIPSPRGTRASLCPPPFFFLTPPPLFSVGFFFGFSAFSLQPPPPPHLVS